MKKTLSIFFALLLFFLSFSTASALVWDGTNCNVEGPCTFCDMVIVASNILDLLVELTFAIGVGMAVYGGVLMMISGGSEERFKNGKSAVTGAVIGIFIAAAAWLIVNQIFLILTDSSMAPWSQISC